MIKAGFKNYERHVAYWRFLKTLTFDWTFEMRQFLEVFKEVVRLRVLNDGKTKDVPFPTLKPGFVKRGLRMDAGSMRQVTSIEGQTMKRQTQTIDWPPLSSYTLRKRTSGGNNYPYPEFPRLLRNGKMLEACVGNGVGHYERVWKSGFVIGTDYHVAVVNHYGGVSNGSTIPARPFFFGGNNFVFNVMKTIHLKVLSAFRYGRGQI